MKHPIALTLSAFMLALMCLATTAQAQSAPAIKANIPFEFTFGDRTYPAGEYSLVRPEQHLLALRDSRGQTIDWLLTEGVDSPTATDTTRLKFVFSSGRHVLAEVWLQQETSGERIEPVPDKTMMVTHHSTETREAEDSRAFTGTKR